MVRPSASDQNKRIIGEFDPDCIDGRIMRRNNHAMTPEELFDE